MAEKLPPKPRKSTHHGKDCFVTRWRRGGRQHNQRFYTSSEDLAMRQYRQWIKQWKADPRVQDPHGSERGWTVKDLAIAYLDLANKIYVKRGKITSTVYTVRRAVETFGEMYGRILLDEIEPRHLAHYRDNVLNSDGVTARHRSTINEWLGLIKKAFKWAAENGNVDPDVALRLTVVANLQKNRTKAIESTSREPVHPDIVEQTMVHTHTQMADMIRLLQLTGMRPGELGFMRCCDIDRTRDVWIYTVSEDKNAHRENHQGRRIALGPKAQATLAPYMGQLKLAAYVFDPRKAPKANRKHTGDHYTHTSIRRAVTRAADRANEAAIQAYVEEHDEQPAARFVPRWMPYQLRHARKQEIERDDGIEAARVTLGHSKTSTTDLYANRDLERAIEVARKSG